jgi:hypothetical protein
MKFKFRYSIQLTNTLSSTSCYLTDKTELFVAHRYTRIISYSNPVYEHSIWNAYRLSASLP